MKHGQLELEGASTAEISVKSDDLFKANISGSCTLKGSIHVKAIELDLDGASRATLEGTANDAKVNVSGSSDLNMPGLVLQNLDIEVSGAGRASVNASGQLKYEVSSSSSLKYLGNPKTLDGSTSGGSSISKGR